MNINVIGKEKRSTSGGRRAFRGLEVGVLGLGIETGTILTDTRKVAMTEDGGIGVVFLQTAEQSDEGLLLFGRSGIGRTAVGVKTALIADADAVLVVVLGMGTDEVFMTRLVHLTITGDVIVVGGEAETGLVAGDEVSDRKRPVAARGATVDDDEVDATHLKN